MIEGGSVAEWVMAVTMVVAVFVAFLIYGIRSICFRVAYDSMLTDEKVKWLRKDK